MIPAGLLHTAVSVQHNHNPLCCFCCLTPGNHCLSHLKLNLIFSKFNLIFNEFNLIFYEFSIILIVFFINLIRIVNEINWIFSVFYTKIK